LKNPYRSVKGQGRLLTPPGDGRKVSPAPRIEALPRDILMKEARQLEQACSKQRSIGGFMPELQRSRRIVPADVEPTFQA
jgi:hypothetical protein